MTLLENNLDNIETQGWNLFGEKIEKLSVKNRIGFVPISIWQPNWQKVKALKEIIGDTAETRVVLNEHQSSSSSRIKRNTADNENEFIPQYSIFNPHLAQMILSAYCPENATIYDPFAGGGTRGLIASAMGHKYSGVELRQEEVDRLKWKMAELNKHFEIVCGDSQSFLFNDNGFNFSYTCPPYYDVEIYSRLENDLSNAGTYKEFLDMLSKCMFGVFRALKEDSLSVWVIGNFRDKRGRLIHFNGDIVRIAQDIGFTLHDELIFWGASGSAAQRSCNFVANRKSVRVHEYILVFKK